MNSSEHPVPAAARPAPPAASQVPRISSGELFCQARSLEIEHEGKVYQLRITRLGKLILTA